MSESEWFSASAATPLTGSEQLSGVDATYRDFWRFAMSDPRVNNVRGYLAEFLVAMAVGAEGSRIERDAYDVLASDGTRIEVKPSAYLQVWNQRRVLLNEGQTPEILCRTAIYQGDPSDVSFINSLLRFRANEDVLPGSRGWSSGGICARGGSRKGLESPRTSPISARRLKPIEFPIRPHEKQHRIIEEADELLAAVVALSDAVRTPARRSIAFRRSLLVAAFFGRLTGSAGDSLTAEEMMKA